MPLIRRLIFLISLLCVSNVATASDGIGADVADKKIGFVTVLGSKIDGTLTFTDAEGKVVPLSSLMSPQIPTIILPVYYGCPRLCGLLMNGFVDLVKKMNLKMGSEYKVITVSFDPLETPDLAKGKSNSVYAEVGREDANASNWHFLVGAELAIKTLMEQIGFRYQKDGDEYAHSSGFIILTPHGEISQYFTGIEFSPWDVRLSLIEASQGSIGSAIDHVLLFCYRFDPSKGKYTWAAFNFLRSGVLASVLLCIGVVYMYSRRARRA